MERNDAERDDAGTADDAGGAARAGRLTGTTAFGLMWLGQMVSMIGSGLTRFALGVWVYQRTGSTTLFTLVILLATLPSLLLSPFAGVVVDRFDRRRLLMASNVAAAAGTLVLIAILRLGTLELWHVYLLVTWGSLVSAFELPAIIASTTVLVPPKQLGRANGMLQLGQAVSGVVAPVSAGALLAWGGLAAVISVDVATFLFAVAMLALVAIPRPATSAAGRGARGSLWREAASGWTYIRDRPGLVGLLVYFAMMNFVLAIATVLVYPLVLSFADAQTLGRVLATAGAGLVVGSVLMTITGGPRRRIHGVLGFGFLAAAALALAALRAEAIPIAAGLFGLMLSVPFINGCSQAIWQTQVPADVQGRVFAMRRMIAQLTGPLGYLLAGPLADRVFGPAMRAGGTLAESPLGTLFGVGPGRGIGVILLLLAVLTAAFSLWGYAQPAIRRIEDRPPSPDGQEIL